MLVVDISWGLTQIVVRELRDEIALIRYVKIGHSLCGQLVLRAHIRIIDGHFGL
jgi:hypothetical protein